MNTQVGKSAGIALLLAAALIAALFAMGVFAPAGVGAQATTPTLTLNPEEGGKGTVITVTGSNLRASTLYQVSADFGGGNAIYIAQTSTAQGGISGTITVPDVAATTRGVKAITATDQSTTTPADQVNASKNFTVKFPTELRATPMKVDNSAERTFTVAGTSFGATSTVSFKVDHALTDSDGDAVTITAPADATADSDGDFTSATITVPANTSAGEITVTATDDATNPNVRTVTVTVTKASVMVSPNPLESGKSQIITVSGMYFPKGTVAFTTAEEDGTTALTGVITTDPATATVGDDGTFTKELVITERPIGVFTIIATEGNTGDAEVAGTADAAAMAKVEAKPAAPMPVSELTVTSGVRMLTATWVASTGADNYTVQWRMSGQEWSTDRQAMTTGNFHEITGLAAGTTYWVQVKPSKAGSLESAYSAAQGTTLATLEAVDDRDALGSTLMATDSNTPGAGVRVELAFHAKEELDLDEKIVVDFGSFGVPDSIDENRVDLRVWGRDGNDGEARMPYEGHPSDVTVSDKKVTIVLGTLSNPNAAPKSLNRIMMNDEVEITFRQSVGITNPTAAKADEADYSIGIDADRDKGRTPDPDNAGEYLDRNYASVVRKVSVDPKKGSSGSDITVTGKGFGTGTATVFLDDGNGMFEDSDTILMRNAAIDKGSFEVTLTVGDSFSSGANTINAIDGAGKTAKKDNAATFTVTSKIEASPSEVALSEEVTIKVEDWGKGQVTAVNFGGTNVPIPATGNTTGMADKGQFKFTVPSNARIGVNRVTLMVGDESEGSVNVTVKALPLDVSPSSVVRGQQVTITGSDFAELETSETITIMIGGKPAKVPSDADVTSTGRVAVTTTVPLAVGDGEQKVVLTAGSMKGEGMVTVAKPSITVSPETSAPGTVIGVTGSGFASSTRIEVFYGGAIEEVGIADSSGDFNVRLDVPAKVTVNNNEVDNIGRTNKVEVKVRNDDTIKASDDHKTPGSGITVTAQAQAGGLITISGTNFKAFSVLQEVKVGGENAMPSPAPESDKNGTFEFQARVPRLGAGSHTVTVKDSAGNSATESFTVVTTPVVSTPKEVFGVLGDKLVVVWRYDNATATWASYSPGAPAELNDLTGVSRGDIVWVQVTEDVMFQGESLKAGWNLISLE